MFRTSRLTREQKDQLVQINVRPESAVYPLMDAGCDADTAIAIVRARWRTSFGIAMLGDDIRIMADLCDPGLLLSLAEAGYNVHELRISMMGGAVTVDSIREAVALGIDPNAVAGWVATGRPLSELAGPIAALPGVDPAVVAAGLALGVTVDDIAWLASTPLGALTDALDDLRVSGYVDPAAARQLADMDTPRRRLVLAMSQLEDFPLVAGLAVAAALEDAAWIDTLTTLILDGTPVYEAIALARADHRIEQERVEQQRVVTVTRAVGPAGRAVTGSS